MGRVWCRKIESVAVVDIRLYLRIVQMFRADVQAAVVKLARDVFNIDEFIIQSKDQNVVELIGEGSRSKQILADHFISWHFFWIRLKIHKF